MVGGKLQGHHILTVFTINTTYTGNKYHIPISRDIPTSGWTRKKSHDAAIRELEDQNMIEWSSQNRRILSCEEHKEVKADGTKVYVGDIRIDRCDNEEMNHLRKINQFCRCE